jgi:radical SAM protein with 4Fe4S-binding SPASM domain
LDSIDLEVTALEQFIQVKEKLREKAPLRYLFWECTLRCNLNCRHCGSDCVKQDNTRHNEVPGEAIARQLASIAEHYSPGDITFAIIGGEPLLREDILGVGRHAADLGYHWGITTNGMLLSEPMIERLKKARLETISISLDGVAADHDALRNCAGSHATVTGAIRNLLADRFYRTFDVICCVSRINIDRLEPFVDELMRMGVPAVRFTPVFSRGRAVRDERLLLDNAGYRKLLGFIAAMRSRELPIQVYLSEEGYWGPEWECVVRDDFHYCGSGIMIGSILHDGGVTGCPSVSRRFVEGNIRETPFLDLWRDRFQMYRRGRKEVFSHQCGECEHWVLCEGGGFHLLEQDLDRTACCLDKLKC